MAFLFIAFGTAMGLGTFVEKWYSTDTARVWIYNATWFEAIMLLFVINFIGNIKKYRLLRWSKWPILVLHLSWIFIIVGAFTTRYISFEGMMPIREGAEENVFYSDKTFLQILVDGEINGKRLRKKFEDDILLTSQGKRTSLPWKQEFDGKKITVAYVNFIEGAKETLVPSADGDFYLKLVEASGGNRHDHFLKSGEISSIHNVLFALNKPTSGAINITTKEEGGYHIETPFDGEYMTMADQSKGKVPKDSLQPLRLRSLYTIAGLQFVLPDKIRKGKYEIVPIPDEEKTPNDQDALLLRITANGKSKEVALLGSKGRVNPPTEIKLDAFDIKINYGSKIHTLPFSIKLNDFIADKYPGTESSYKSFKSKVTVLDKKPFDFDIYMNHIMDYKGYRFFQANFDKDEKGTVLSVNHDFWGKWITYIGYFLLYAGLLGTLFFGKTRFKELQAALVRIKKVKSKAILLLLLLVGGYMQAQENHKNHSVKKFSVQEIDSIIKTLTIDKKHSDQFGTLVVQDHGGRMKPIHTFTSELLRKLTKKDHYKGLDANQTFLAMMLHPVLWYHTNIIALDWKNDSIRKLIGLPESQKNAKALDFIDAAGKHKLAPYLQEAYATNTPNVFQKDFVKLDQKLRLLDRTLSGGLLKIFPLPNHSNNKWVSPLEYRSGKDTVANALYDNYIRKGFSYYLFHLRKAKKSGNYEQADMLLEALKKNQKKMGYEVLPTSQKIKAEIFYNNVNIFNRLYRYYALFGMSMMLVIILQIFKDRKAYRVTIKSFRWIIYLMFILHTAGLILRWYISGHAPWSDAYESIIYVAWATMLFGIYFGKTNDMTLSATTFVSAMLLFLANQNWIDPEIANLVPVLDSYWLMIHVAVIVGSYGPFTLGAILGIVAMILMILTNKKNKKLMTLHLKELTIINEMALTIGLVMLTIGNFLGGMWANESWGRYWGWDPKETWALISIMVYAFVIHMRFIPGLRGRWTFNFFSILAFASIMMTYFGVNFYLSGLHSYASGDQIITPSFVWYTVIAVLLLSAVGYWKNYKFRIL